MKDLLLKKKRILKIILLWFQEIANKNLRKRIFRAVRGCSYSIGRRWRAVLTGFTRLRIWRSLSAEWIISACYGLPGVIFT